MYAHMHSHALHPHLSSCSLMSDFFLLSFLLLSFFLMLSLSLSLSLLQQQQQHTQQHMQQHTAPVFLNTRHHQDTELARALCVSL